MHGIKNYILKELKDHEANIDTRSMMSAGMLDRIHILTDTYKNICKIEKLEGCIPAYHEEHKTVHEDEYSEEKVRKMLEKLYRDADHESTRATIRRYLDEL